MASIEIETTVKVETTVEMTAAAELFKDDVMSPMDVDFPNVEPLEDDEDDIKDESDLEEEEDASASTSEPPKSRSETPAPAAKKVKPGPQLIGHLPRAEEEAMKTFVELPDNFYQYQTLGRSREALESMTCDCTYEPGVDNPDMACGRSADCINRLTQVECVDGDCRCKKHCRNQRMQRKEYADIEIVKTEMKGFGLRAGSDIQKDDFIYEYIGDIVSQPTFAKRMREYAEEGIKHFYFMMLQKDEFLDATKRGGIGRFANHSCNPNCYVAKWTVGQHVRMGIYAKRNIKKDEELTFNYNVDRYGHEAQQCYCGEPNCVGILGGKTQTDVAAMDDLYLDALGISDEVALYGLKGNKKKKSKKLDEDYCPELKPIILKDVPKVVQALNNTRSRVVLLRLLGRIRLTSDPQTLRQLMRFRGCSLIRHLLEENMADTEICILVLESLRLWPFTHRNKIDDSQIEETVKKFEESEQEHLRSLSKELLEAWSLLTTGYRIPKRLATEVAEDEKEKREETSSEVKVEEEKPTLTKRARPYEMFAEFDKPGTQRTVAESPGKASIRNQWKKNGSPLRRETVEAPKRPKARKIMHREEEEATRVPPPEPPSRPTVIDTSTIIANALAKAEEERKKLQALEDAKRAEEERVKKEMEAKEASRRRRQERRERKERHKNMTADEKEAMKVKRLQKLIGEVCVRQMNHQCRHKLDKETFKKRAKEMTDVLVEKERKSSWFAEGKLDTLPEHKAAKMKQFAHDFIKKVLHRMKKEDKEKTRERHASTSHADPPVGPNTASTSSLTSAVLGTLDDLALRTPETPELDDGPGMSIEEALGLNGDDAAADDDDMDMDDEDDDGDEEKSGDPSPASDAQRVSVEPPVAIVGQDVESDPGPAPFPSQIDGKSVQHSPETTSPRLDKGKGRASWGDEIPAIRVTIDDSPVSDLT